MVIRKTLTRVALVATAAAAAVGLSLTSTPAQATEANIDTWTQTACSADGFALCLWYHPGQGVGGAGWGATSDHGNITGTFFLAGNPGNQGSGQRVAKNAGSMSNGGPCTDYVFTGLNEAGNSNYLFSGFGGNLTNSNPQLHNNEQSYDIAC